MPKVFLSSLSKYYAYTTAVIVSFSEIMPSYSHCLKAGLVYIAIMVLFSRQPSTYSKYTKANI